MSRTLKVVIAQLACSVGLMGAALAVGWTVLWALLGVVVGSVAVGLVDPETRYTNNASARASALLWGPLVGVVFAVLRGPMEPQLPWNALVLLTPIIAFGVGLFVLASTLIGLDLGRHLRANRER